MDSPYDAVMGFYDFWYNIDSWRVFNYLDEEDTSNAEKYVGPCRRTQTPRADALRWP